VRLVTSNYFICIKQNWLALNFKFGLMVHVHCRSLAIFGNILFKLILLTPKVARASRVNAYNVFPSIIM